MRLPRSGGGSSTATTTTRTWLHEATPAYSGRKTFKSYWVTCPFPSTEHKSNTGNLPNRFRRLSFVSSFTFTFPHFLKNCPALLDVPWNAFISNFSFCDSAETCASRQFLALVHLDLRDPGSGWHFLDHWPLMDQKTMHNPNHKQNIKRCVDLRCYLNLWKSWPLTRIPSKKLLKCGQSHMIWSHDSSMAADGEIVDVELVKMLLSPAKWKFSGKRWAENGTFVPFLSCILHPLPNRAIISAHESRVSKVEETCFQNPKIYTSAEALQETRDPLMIKSVSCTPRQL